MTMELGTVLHGSSVLAEALNCTLESLTFGNCGSIYLVSLGKDVSLDLISELVLLCVLKAKLSDIFLG